MKQTLRSITRLASMAAVVAATLSIAQSSALSDQDAANNAVDKSYPGATLILADNDLPGRIKLFDAKIRPIGKLHQGQVKVQNVTEDSYNLEYRFSWMDGDGFDVDADTTWHRFSLTPNAIQPFKTMATDPNARQMVFTVRFPKDATISRP